MIFKNYQSDFEFYQELRNGQSISAAPFELTYYIPGKEQKLIVSFDGESYKNCRPDGNGIVVVVDYSQVQLGIGSLRCTSRYYLDNSYYPDGVCEPVSDFEVGITLHRGASDDMGDLVATPLPSYHIVYTEGGGYEPPEGGIPREDLADDVQTSLRKADTALQEGALSDYAKKSEVQQAVDTPIVNQTLTSVTIEPNVLNVWGVVDTLDITFAEGTDGVLNEYMVQFSSGETPTTLTLPNTIKWMAAPSIQANKVYQLSVVNNLAIIGEFGDE